MRPVAAAAAVVFALFRRSQIVLPFSGIAVDGAGDLFVADSQSYRLLKRPKGGAQVVVPLDGMTIDPVIPTGVTAGTTVYGNDLVNSAVLAPTTSSYSVPALPTGQVLYATLSTEIDGAWINYNLIGFIAAARATG